MSSANASTHSSAAPPHGCPMFGHPCGSHAPKPSRSPSVGMHERPLPHCSDDSHRSQHPLRVGTSGRQLMSGGLAEHAIWLKLSHFSPAAPPPQSATPAHV